MCLRGCSSNNNCAVIHNKNSNDREKVCAMFLTGVINHEEGDLDNERLTNATTPSLIAKEQLVRHKSLNLPSATETDLAIAFGQKTFFLRSTLETIKSLRNATGEKIHDKTEEFRRCFKPLQITNKITSKTLDGGIEEANELVQMHAQE